VTSAIALGFREVIRECTGTDTVCVTEGLKCLQGFEKQLEVKIQSLWANK